jgi:hypothetical protein
VKIFLSDKEFEILNSSVFLDSPLSPSMRGDKMGLSPSLRGIIGGVLTKEDIIFED